MDLARANALSREYKISKDYIVREEYEMLLLREIFESEFGNSLIFKGGTALRLAYKSVRFSEDLDFNLKSELNQLKFRAFLKKLGRLNPNITEVEVKNKFYTVFALVRVNESFLDRPFSIKIEVSKRQQEWIKGKDYDYKIIQSNVAPFTVLANVVSLEAILLDKIDAIKNRKAARDVYDYWYVNQLLHKEVKLNFSRYDKTRAKMELHKLLPRNYWELINSWLE